MFCRFVLVLFLLKSACSGVASADEAGVATPRLAYWCAGLLSAPAPTPASRTDLKEIRRLVAERLYRNAPFVNAIRAIFVADADLSVLQPFETITPDVLRRVSGRLYHLDSDLARKRDRRFSRQVVLTGREAIRDFLNEALADADRLNERHPLYGATKHFRVKRSALLKRTLETLFNSIGALGAITLTAEYTGDAYGAWPLIAAAAFSSFIIHQSVITKARGVYLGLKNEWLLERFRRGQVEARPVERAKAQIAQARELLRRLEAPGSLDGTFAYAGYSVTLPLSLSMTTSFYLIRPAPAAGEIIAAERTSGDVTTPTDARRVTVEQIFYVDAKTGEPTLLLFVREPRYAIDSVQ